MEKEDCTNEKKRRRSAKHIVMIALLVALSLVVHIVESLLPPLFVPGAKPGLSNIFSLLALVIFGPADALVVVLARVLLSAFITGAVSSLPYGLAAGVASILVSSLLVCLFSSRLSIIAVSMCSAVVHNLVQNVVFALMSGSTLMLAYSPYLALIALPCGAMVGIVVWLAIWRMPDKLLISVIDGGKN